MIGTKDQKNLSFAAGATLLMLSSIIVKLIGVCYKIPLVRLLGTQGMGYFNAAYDVYALLCVISTTGLPVAVSVVINRYPQQQRRIFRMSLTIFCLLGLLGAMAVFIGADRVALWIGAPYAAQSLRFIAPAVLFVCLSGAFRGYYQAKRNMTPTAVSQVIEAAGKLAFGLVFAHIAIRHGGSVATSSAFAVLGLSVGTLLCMLYLMLCNKRTEKLQAGQNDVSGKQLLSQLLAVALPVTLGAVLTGLSKMIDLSLIMRRLQDGGMEQGTAVAMYGCYSSMVIPLFNVIPALFGSLAMPLVPHLGHAIQKSDRTEQANVLSTAFRWGIAISIPASLGMGMMSRYILELLFAGTGETQYAVPLLIIICTAVPASCMITATSAVLQAYGRAWLPMVSTAIGCLIKAASLYVLCAIPQIGILSAPVSTLLCCTVTVCINLVGIAGVAPPFGFAKCFIRSLFASAVSVGVAACVQRMLVVHADSLLFCMSATIAVAVLIYLPIAYKCDLIRISDIHSIIQKEKDD